MYTSKSYESGLKLLLDYHHFVQIDFSSLIDVRIFNNGRSEPGNGCLNSTNEGTAGDVTSDKPTVLPTQGIFNNVHCNYWNKGCL